VTSCAPAVTRPELTSGCVLGGRYRIERKLGTGGMGEVWRAAHVTLPMQVAVKVLLAKALGFREIAGRFEREALLLCLIHGEHMPRALDFLHDDVYGPVLVTELVEGESLATVLARPLSVEDAIDLGIDLATGLGELHRAHVVHRDLKPSNVILRPIANGRTRAVIIDLGVSLLVEDDPLPPNEANDISTIDLVVGTVAYMAPEQILRCGEVTAAADLYALGALLFRAVTGGPVFGQGLERLELVRTKLTCEAPALLTGRHDRVAEGLAAVVAHALERDPARRYQSAEELRTDLFHLRRIASERAARASARTGARPACSDSSGPFSAIRETVRTVFRRLTA
jgi:serine/threonine-protein kinase